MKGSSDFRELLSAFNAARVRFIVVGAYAVMHHTEPRYTKDLDVWIERSPANARRVLAALRDFGAPTMSLNARDLCDPDIVYQIGVEPVRVDILTGVSGVRFATAFANAVRGTYDGVHIRVLSLGDTIRAKRAAGRPQDVLDLDRLERARKAQRMLKAGRTTAR